MIIYAGKVVILDENESLYKGEVNSKLVDKASLIIQINSVTGDIDFLKIRKLTEFKTKLIRYWEAEVLEEAKIHQNASERHNAD